MSGQFNRAPDDRRRLMTSTERLIESSRTLDGAVQTAGETEDVAEGVLSDLRAQRGVIENSRNRMGQVGENVRESRSVLSSMVRSWFPW